MNDTKYHLAYRTPKSKLPESLRINDPMRTYEIVETSTGKTMCESHSPRHYVAMLVYVSPIDGKSHVSHRFGREDLIGKGDSKRIFENNSGNFYLARLKPQGNEGRDTDSTLG